MTMDTAPPIEPNTIDHTPTKLASATEITVLEIASTIFRYAKGRKDRSLFNAATLMLVIDSMNGRKASAWIIGTARGSAKMFAIIGAKTMVSEATRKDRVISKVQATSYFASSMFSACTTAGTKPKF